MKVLIVDDSAFMRNMIKQILGEGHELREASNGDEAVQTFQEFQPQLVFLDIIMPGRNGIDVLKEIRSSNPEAQVVMCTSIGGQDKVIQECVDAGAADFITKPFTPDEVAKVISRFQG